MANQLPDALRKVMTDMDENQGVVFGEAIQHADGMKLHNHAGVVVKKLETKGDVNVGDMPAVPLNSHSGTKIQYMADVVLNHPGPIPWEDLERLGKGARFSELPEPFKLKREPTVEYVLNIYVVKRPNGNYDIWKDVDFKGAKLKVSTADAFAYGMAVQYQYGTHYRVGRAAVQYMLEKLEGWQLRFCTLVAAAKPTKRNEEWTSKAEGYKFIREKGPRANNMNQFMEFADREIHDPQSPIYGWEESRVKESLNNYLQGRKNAKTLRNWVLFLYDMAPFFLNVIVRPCLATMRTNSIVWLGKSRVGKSTGSKTVAFAISRFEISLSGQEDTVEPAIVTAKHFDFFKAEPVTRVKPAVFDDGELQDRGLAFKRGREKLWWPRFRELPCEFKFSQMFAAASPKEGVSRRPVEIRKGGPGETSAAVGACRFLPMRTRTAQS